MGVFWDVWDVLGGKSVFIFVNIHFKSSQIQTKIQIKCLSNPIHNSHLAAVTPHVNERLSQGSGQTPVRNIPNLDGGVIRCTGNHIVVKRIPVKVKNRSRMALNIGGGAGHAPRLVQWTNSKRATATGHGNGKELCGGLDVSLLTGYGRQPEANVGGFGLGGVSEYVAELRGADKVTHIGWLTKWCDGTNLVEYLCRVDLRGRNGCCLPPTTDRWK